MIDEGSGDKYAHAQSNYLEKRIYDDQGRYNYKYIDNYAYNSTSYGNDELLC